MAELCGVLCIRCFHLLGSNGSMNVLGLLTASFDNAAECVFHIVKESVK